jgi:transposase
MKSSKKNCIHICMSISNVGIASVLSDSFGKTADEIMSYLQAHAADYIDEKAVHKLIKKRPKPNRMK